MNKYYPIKIKHPCSECKKETIIEIPSLEIHLIFLDLDKIVCLECKNKSKPLMSIKVGD